jgi:hypothetical protein
MNQDFIDSFNARLADCIAGLEYDYKPTPGEKKAPQIVTPMFPPREGAHTEGETYPFVHWAIYKGAFRHMRSSPFSVYVSAGIYTAGTMADGSRDILELTLALGRIVERRSFPPYVLSAEAEFIVGDQDNGYEGAQPHPYYTSRILLNFSAAKSSKL